MIPMLLNKQIKRPKVILTATDLLINVSYKPNLKFAIFTHTYLLWSFKQTYKKKYKSTILTFPLSAVWIQDQSYKK